jgi:uncharacterized protein (DUF433 family)
MDGKLGHGLYTFAEAAKLTGLRLSRIREWFRGRKAEGKRKPVFRGDYAPVDGDYAISFYDLVDVYVAGQLREHGVSLQTVRRVYERMASDLDTPHPFCRRELLTDGKTIFMRNTEEVAAPCLAEVLTGQGVFPEIILPFLKRIDYDKVRLLALRWHIADAIVIDPTICFGKPIVAAVGIPTAILAAAYHANNADAELVGEWYNVHPDHVRAAVAFEDGMAA